jgi:AbiV family abortive infection protein
MEDIPKQNADKNLKAREACLANAEVLLKLAEENSGKGVDHIAFHLGLLALEEIGKAILVTVGFAIAASETNHEGPVGSLDDHIKKIFWALWTGILFRASKYTVKDIEDVKGLANMLHGKRLEYLYTDPENPLLPLERQAGEDVKKLIAITRPRLEMEKANKIVAEFSEEEQKELNWFFTSLEDPEKRKQIFSGPSIQKLAEVQGGKAWISWLYNLYKENQEEMRQYAEAEIKRQRPPEGERMEPKYKVRIKVQSQSHSIRDNAFDDWNKGVEATKIYVAKKKERSNFAKSEIYIDFTIPKGISPADVYDHGFFLSKSLVNSINIATKGLFWWDLPKEIEKYYETIIDLEATKESKGGEVGVVITTGKRLKMDWDKERLVLKKEDIGEIMFINAFLMFENQHMEEFMKAYSMGITLLSKTDIHLRLESNAFDEFYKALKEAFLALGDWDEKNDFDAEFLSYFKREFPGFTDTEKIISFAKKLRDNPQVPHNITQTEAMQMKWYCDVYIHLKAANYFKKRQESLKSADPSQNPSNSI